MPVVELSYSRLQKLVGKVSKKQIADSLPFLGLDIESENKDYNEELNQVFRDFKSNGVDNLILDLRYNPGGSTYTQLILASLITGQFTGEIYSQRVFHVKSKMFVFFNKLKLKFSGDFF